MSSSIHGSIRSMDDNDSRNLQALLEWLKTFPQFPYVDDDETPESVLSELNVAKSIVCVVDEVLDRPSTDLSTLSSVESVWSLVFSSLSTPLLLQQLSGRRLEATELQFLLLQALLRTSVTCPRRVEYIPRILQLPQTVQRALMTLIEEYKPDRTPTKSPRSRFHQDTVCETPRSSGSRPAGSERSYASSSSVRHGTTPNTSNSLGRYTNTHTTTTPGRSNTTTPTRTATPGRRAKTPSRAGTPTQRFSTTPRNESHSNQDSPLEEETTLLALLAWIRTFPELTGMGALTKVEHLTDPKVSLAILHVAESLCGQDPSPPAFSNVEDTWAALHNLLLLVAPTLTRRHVPHQDMFPQERQGLLTALLSFAVSPHCGDRQANLAKVLRLPRPQQHVIMALLEGRTSTRRSTTPQSSTRRSTTPQSSTRRSTTPISNRRNHAELDVSTPTGFTPLPKKSSLSNMARDSSLFSPGTLDGALQVMVQDLKTHNESLRQELEQSTQREAGLAIRLQEVETKLKKDLLQVESQAQQQAHQVHEQHVAEIEKLKQELQQLQTAKTREQETQKKLAQLQDELDVLQHAQERLVLTEEKLNKCRERLEELNDVKEALQREEEAHSASVEECLRLETELKALQPLKRQLEDYQTRATEAQVQLAACQAELERLQRSSHELHSVHEQVLQGARSFQEEAETLRQQLSGDDSNEQGGPSVAQGLSELNPHVKEELVRLRTENAQLREFAAARQDDQVQLLQERLDDVQRLAERFKDLYLTTKSDLESTSTELEETKTREGQFRQQVAEWTTKCDELDQLTQHLQQDLEQKTQELEEYRNLLEEASLREKDLNETVDDLIKQRDQLEQVSQENLAEWDKTKEQLSETIELLVQSQDREKDLHMDLENLEEKLEQEQQRSAAFENDYNLTSEELETTKTELNVMIDREKEARVQLVEFTEAKENLLQELQEAKQLHEQEQQNAEKKLAETVANLEAKATTELEDLQDNMNLLLEDERASSRTKLEKAQTEYHAFVEKSTSEYEELRNKLTLSLETTIRDYETRIENLKEEYHQEMEKAKAQAEIEKDNLIKKGKNMMKESRERTEETIRELEDELEDTRATLSKVRKEKDEFEHKTRAKINSYKHKLQFSMTRVQEMTQENDQLADSMKELEREKAKVLEESERFRRQLGGRYGADGKVQNQMEMLQKEFNVVLEENRSLKKKLSSSGTTSVLGSISENGESDFRAPYARGGMSGSTLSALREEYEEQIQALNDEKRELIMRNSAAITDVQKAEQRAWELEKQIERLKEELTSAHLALQRAELRIEDQIDDQRDTSAVTNDQSFHSAREQEGDQENSGGGLLVDLNVSTQSTESPPVKVLSPSNRQNVPSSSKKRVSFSVEETNTIPEHHPTKNMGRSLVDLTQQSVNDPLESGQPECKQS